MTDAMKLADCPFCGSEIKHVESWAKSFNPPRLWHEWHHDENMECPVRRYMGKIVCSANDAEEIQATAIRRWNARTAPQALAATPAVGGEAIAWRVTAGKNAERHLFENKRDAQLMRDELEENGWLDVLLMPLYAAQPASPLRGMEDLAPSPCSDLSIGELIEWLDNPQWTNGYINSDAANHMSAAAELIERLVSSAPPEQPAAVSQEALDWAAAESEKVEAYKAANPDWQNHTRPAREVFAQPAADPVTGRETIREIVHANAKTTLIGFNEISDQNAEFICDQISRKVELALLSTAPDKQPLRYGEPVWPGNENDDLDKGGDA